MNAKLFDLFLKHKNPAKLFIEIEELIKQERLEAIGRTSEKYYDVLRKLYNSINNAGWQERRDEQIDLVNNEMWYISENFEQFLP